MSILTNFGEAPTPARQVVHRYLLPTKYVGTKRLGRYQGRFAVSRQCPVPIAPKHFHRRFAMQAALATCAACGSADKRPTNDLHRQHIARRQNSYIKVHRRNQVDLFITSWRSTPMNVVASQLGNLVQASDRMLSLLVSVFLI